MKKLTELISKRPAIAFICVFIAYSVVGTIEYNDAARMGNVAQEQQV